MKIEDSGLRPDTQNANEGTQRGLGLLDKSLRKLGAGRSILVDKNGNVIAGNKTLERAADIDLPVQIVETDGKSLVVVKRTDLDLYSETDKRARQLAYADNKIGELDLAWKPEQIATDFEPLDLGEWGFDAEPETKDAEPQIDRAAELNEKWKVVTGDLWQIGEHRLLCGDSTKREDVDRVMQGEKADMVFTDPPYNVASESRNYAADKSKAMKDLSESEWDKDFDIKTIFPVLESVMSENCAVYVCTSQWLVQSIWEWMWTWSDFCSYCVWCKPNPMPSLSKRHWTWATELIPYAVRGKHISNFPVDGHALNWWNIAKEKDTDHPTEKVIGVPTIAIEFSSVPNAIVFDGFCGSGTTMVACENLHRKCRAIEISPNYCAVILERMNTAFPDLKIERI